MTRIASTWRWPALALALQLLFVAMIPVVSDEAYFVNWGRHPSLGYYDHPPMTGWVAGLFAGNAHADLLLRLTMVALGLAMAALLAAQAREFRSPAQARLLALAWWLLPINLITFGVYLNDTLAHAFTIMFVVALYRGWRDFRLDGGGIGWSLVAGVALGLALLSKYIVATYVIAVVAMLLLDWRGNFSFLLRRLSLVALVSATLFALTLVWNYQHCQVNLAFNFLNRQGGPPQRGLLEFFVSLLFLLGPLLLVWLYRLVRPAQALRREPMAASGFFLRLFLTSVAATLLIALWRGQFGTHWGVGLSFLAVLALAEHRASEIPPRLLAVHAGYAVLMVGGLLLAVVAVRDDLHLLPAAKWQKLHRQYEFYQLTQSGRLAQAIQRDWPRAQVASESYGFAASMSNHGVDTAVLFSPSKYGRNDDIFRDYAALDGRQVLIIDVGLKQEADKLRPFFASLHAIDLDVDGQRFPALVGESFRYEAYRQVFIRAAVQDFYAKARPLSGACYMDRYGLF